LNHRQLKTGSPRVQLISKFADERGVLLPSVWLIAIVLALGCCQQFVAGQVGGDQGQPFIGFQSLDGSRMPLGSPVVDRDAGASIMPREYYPYPAGGSVGYAQQGGNVMTRGQAPVRTSLGASINSSQNATGTLNRFAGNTTSPVTWGRTVVPAPATTYQARPQVVPQPTRSASPLYNPRPAVAQSQMVRVARLNQNVVQQTASTISASSSNALRETSGNVRTNPGDMVRVARVPQGNCVCVPQAAYNSAAANQAPAINGAVPNYAGYQVQPGVGTPQFYAPSSNVITPYGRSSRVYTPLIPLVRPNPRTYLGQGIIGQPAAYVDGQPLRNLIRYVTP
jgi:hypothetical protein